MSRGESARPAVCLSAVCLRLVTLRLFVCSSAPLRRLRSAMGEGNTIQRVGWLCDAICGIFVSYKRR